jgi:hypothetical protein
MLEERGGEDAIKMGLKEIEQEVTGRTHLVQDRFSGELHIFEISGGQRAT